jgi:hypothetical protein
MFEFFKALFAEIKKMNESKMPSVRFDNDHSDSENNTFDMVEIYREAIKRKIDNNEDYVFLSTYDPDSIEVSKKASLVVAEIIRATKKNLKVVLKDPDDCLFNDPDIIESLKDAIARRVDVKFMFFETESVLGEFGELLPFLDKNGVGHKRMPLYYQKEHLDKEQIKSIYNKDTVLSDDQRVWMEVPENTPFTAEKGATTYHVNMNDTKMSKVFGEYFDRYYENSGTMTEGDEWKFGDGT